MEGKKIYKNNKEEDQHLPDKKKNSSIVQLSLFFALKFPSGNFSLLLSLL